MDSKERLACKDLGNDQGALRQQKQRKREKKTLVAGVCLHPLQVLQTLVGKFGLEEIDPKIKQNKASEVQKSKTKRKRRTVVAGAKGLFTYLG